MTVLEIFKQVNIEELADKIMELHPSYYSKKEDYIQNKKDTLEILNKFYNDIENIELFNIEDEEFKEYKDFVLLVNEYYDDNDYDNINIFDLNKKSFDINTIDKNKLSKYFVVDGIHLNQLNKNNKVLSYTWDEMRKIENIFEDGIITYGIDYLTRKIVLNLMVAEPSITKYGLLIVAAELFWELTFYGLTEEQIQHKGDELLSRVDSIDTEDMKNIENVEDFIEDVFGENLDEEILTKEDLDFSMNFSIKIAEYNHTLENEFLKEIYNWVLKNNLI